MLHDAFANGEGQVESTIGGRAFFKPGDDAQGVEIVVEAEPMRLQRTIQRLFSGVAKRWMTDVMGEGQGFRQVGIETESAREGACGLSDLKGVGKAATEVIAWGETGETSEDLRLACQAAEGPSVQDAPAVSCEGSAI